MRLLSFKLPKDQTIHMTRFIIFIFCITYISCSSTKEPVNVNLPSPKNQQLQLSIKHLSGKQIKDKILGALVGSAIGDAMGASTEMWTRSDIQQSYGYINGLTPALREQSPEGTWQHNLIAGATTDDTRWKYFIGQYLITNHNQYTPKAFAIFINDYYDNTVHDLSDDKNKSSTDALDGQIEKIDWIKEWARVSKAYVKGNAEYQLAQGRFYGGEMSCAGLLYSPMFGLVSKHSEDAYRLAYEHALFDIGYAKDISATASTMTYLAMYGEDFSSIVDSSLMIDPYGYRDSRLIGRLVVAAANDAKSIVKSASNFDSSDSLDLVAPVGYPGTDSDWQRQDYIYQELEKRQKAIAFHAGEIWDILYVSLLYGEGDFIKTMSFIVNYGRDNDTVAAIAGTILGAHIGYENLPEDLKTEIIKVSRDVIGIDLNMLANDLYKKMTTL